MADSTDKQALGAAPSIVLPTRDRIAPALRNLRRSLPWGYEWNGEKFTKVPIDYCTGRKGNYTDAALWMSLEDALRYCAQHGFGLAIFLREEDGIVGVDIDGCYDPITKQMTEDAQQILRDLDSYTEISPSGKGIRAFAFGTKPGPRCRKDKFEMYNHNRFLTLTGNRLDFLPADLQQRQEAINAVYAWMPRFPR